jgi:hypothetical protein
LCGALSLSRRTSLIERPSLSAYDPENNRTGDTKIS